MVSVQRGCVTDMHCILDIRNKVTVKCILYTQQYLCHIRGKTSQYVRLGLGLGLSTNSVKPIVTRKTNRKDPKKWFRTHFSVSKP